MNSDGWWVRYFYNGWNIFHHLWNTVRKIKSFSLLTNTPAVRMLMYFLLHKKMKLWWCVCHTPTPTLGCVILWTTEDILQLGCFRVAEGKSWKNCWTVPDQFTFFALHVGNQQQLQMLQVVGRRVAIGQLMQIRLKTACSCRATNKPTRIPNLNEHQHSNLSPHKDAPYLPCSSWSWQKLY